MDFKKKYLQRFEKIFAALFLLIVITVLLKTLQYFELCCQKSSPPHGFNKSTLDYMQDKKDQREFDNFVSDYIRKNI